MEIDIVNNPSIEQLRLRSSSTPAGRFEQLLAASQAKADETDTADQARADEARKAAEQFVASALVLPLLAQIRNDPFRSDLFHAGFAEDAFQSRLDTILADRITRRADFPLVDSVLNHVLGIRRTSRDVVESAPPAPGRVNTDE